MSIVGNFIQKSLILRVKTNISLTIIAYIICKQRI